MTIWDNHRNILAPDTSPLSSFLGQPWFPPAREPRSFGLWRKIGIYHLCNISTSGILLSKTALEEWYTVAIPCLFCHSHLLPSTMRTFTSFECLLKSKSSCLSGFISICYRLCKAVVWAQPSSFQKKWAIECNFTSLTEDWARIWASPLFKSHSLLIKTQFIKALSRWYITPWQLSLFSSLASSKYWKGYGQVGTLLHCLWECPRIKSFWLQVLFHIKKITGVTIPQDTKLILLDLWNEPLRYHSDAYFISFINGV